MTALNPLSVNVGLLKSVAAVHPHPLLFATVSGAHLYGFPSPDSDFDLRGVHMLPPRELLGLDTGPETIESNTIRDGREIDLVTHDAAKFFKLLLRPNGYVLEQLLSPLIIHTTPEHAELVALAPACLTKFHAHHYLGFAETQWRLFCQSPDREGGVVGDAEPPAPHRRIKPLLYTFRVLLTGIHLMRTGRLEANLLHLNETAKLPYIPDLIAHKTATAEHCTLAESEHGRFESEYHRLTADLESARDTTHLPEAPTARPALHDLLLRIRLPR